MRIVFLSLSVLLSSFGTRALAATASFDSPGRSLTPVLHILKLNAAQTVTPPAAPVRDSMKPIVLAISGLHPDEIGIGLEFRHILALWKWLFPGKKADEEKIKTELEAMHLELNAIQREAGMDKEHGNSIERDILKAVQNRKLNITVEGFDWSRDASDTFGTIKRLAKTLKELEARAQGRPIHLVTHSWGTILAHEALFNIAEEGTPIEIESFITMGSPLVPINLVLRIFGNIDRINERLQSRIIRPKGVARWLNLFSKNDPFAGEIRAADDNIRVDRLVDAYEARLLEHLNGGASRSKVNSDLRALKNGIGWHLSYTSCFKAKFIVLNEEVDWPVFEEQIGTILQIVETN